MLRFDPWGVSDTPVMYDGMEDVASEIHRFGDGSQGTRPGSGVNSPRGQDHPSPILSCHQSVIGARRTISKRSAAHCPPPRPVPPCIGLETQPLCLPRPDMKTSSKMVATVLLALLANVSWSKASLIPGLASLLNTRHSKAARLDSANSPPSLARLLKGVKTQLQLRKMSSERHQDAIHQGVARQLDMDVPVCNQTTFEDDTCSNVAETSSFPIPCTQLPGVDELYFQTGIVNGQLFLFSHFGTDCNSPGVALGVGTDWEGNCIFDIPEEEYIKVSCEAVPPTLPSSNLGTCELRGYDNNQCTGQYESAMVPSGCSKIEDSEGATFYAHTKNVNGLATLFVYAEEGCTGVSAGLVFGPLSSASQCLAFGENDTHVELRCDGSHSSACSLLICITPFRMAISMILFFYMATF